MIYIADISACTEEMLLPHVCEERKAYAAKYKQPIDRIRSLGVAALLDVALRMECGQQEMTANVLRTEYGKQEALAAAGGLRFSGDPVVLLHDEHQRPYILPTDGLFLNTGDCAALKTAAARLEDSVPCISLSHSGNYVAVAIDRLAVGIDIEQIRPCNDSLIKRFFTEAEKRYIGIHSGTNGEASGSESRDRSFTEIWTLKESFMKAVGMGLSLGPDTFSVLESGEEAGLFDYEQSHDTHAYVGRTFGVPCEPTGNAEMPFSDSTRPTGSYILSVCVRRDSEMNARMHTSAQRNTQLNTYIQGDFIHEICLPALFS